MKTKVVCIKEINSVYHKFRVGDVIEDAIPSEPNHLNYNIGKDWYSNEYFRDIKWERKRKIQKITKNESSSI